MNNNNIIDIPADIRTSYCVLFLEHKNWTLSEIQMIF